MNEWKHPDVPETARNDDVKDVEFVHDLSFDGAETVVRAWEEQIARILHSCFGVNEQEAAQVQQEFVTRLSETNSPSLQLAALHFSPFQVAADLAESRDEPVDMADARKRYVEMFVEASERPDPEAQTYAQPDDPTLALNRDTMVRRRDEPSHSGPNDRAS